jgi:hypothetical protein
VILTEGQIKAQVRAIRKKSNRSTAAFALRSDGPWTGSPRLKVDGLLHRVAYCRSDLELRELLRGASADNEPLIALCPFASDSLGEDVLARLAKRRIHPPDTTEILGSLFQVNSVDSRIFSTPALPQALVESAPTEGFPAVAGGVLDLQTAWAEVIGRVVGDREVATNLGRLLEATLDVASRGRIDQMSSELRRDFFSWAALNLDRSAGWMSHLVSANKTSDLVPFGLMLELAFEPSLTANAGIAAARVRLESWFSGQTMDAGAARSWAAAARAVTQALYRRPDSGPLLSSVLIRFDELLAEFRIGDAAARSDFSPAGLEQRVRVFSQVLGEFAQSGAPSNLDAKRLVGAIENMQGHMLAGEHQRRIERCQMAARLAAWIASGAKISSGASLSEMIEGYARVGGFVDWARMIVQEGDSEAALNKAYDALITRAEEICGTFEANFAAKLAEWTAYGAKAESAYVPIEEALETMIGPLAAQAPVLLLVMDGMSVAVFRELLSDIVQRGNWLECKPGKLTVPAALLATVPSITEISRRALFRGRLHPESTPTEQSAFSSNERLFSLCGGQSRPVLFLKGDLQTSGEAGLATEVKQAIANKKCRVVAMVLNAIDDHLSGSDQIAPRWNLDFVRPLRELLQLAAEAGRTLVLTSDHGHVLEHKTVLKPITGIGGDRYRADGGAPTSGEIRMSGQRVQQAMGRQDVTVAWSRDIRYAGKKHGYHGGVSPAEIVIPFAILRHLSSSLPETWTDVSPSPYWPDWWRLSGEQAMGFVSAIAAEVETKLTAGLDLFTHAAAKAQQQDWIEQLLSGEIYGVQCSRAVRGAPDRQQVATFIEVLSARGGSMPREALAERLGLPLLRLNGLVPNLARVLNVDGYEVLGIDAPSGTVVLNIALLKKQFAVSD